jgi:DinB superfamily
MNCKPLVARRPPFAMTSFQNQKVAVGTGSEPCESCHALARRANLVAARHRPGASIVFSYIKRRYNSPRGESHRGETTQMNETPQQYIQRILGHAEGHQPLKVQAATPKKIKTLIKAKPAAKLRKRPASDKWSVAEIITHLVDTEIVGGYRMRMILGAPGSPIPAFDQDAWVLSGHYSKRDAHQSLEQFTAVREANLALLKTLTPEQWKHYGMHSERGQETIEHIVKMFAGHDLNHIKQIQTIVAPPKKRP